MWVYNGVPNVKSELTPLEFITREWSYYRDLLCCHVWGCPVFVLKAKLQNDQKRPKCNLDLEGVNMLASQMNTLLLWPMFNICPLISSHLNLFLMTSSKQ